eukprot:1855829-Rhodomonas_salina.2
MSRSYVELICYAPMIRSYVMIRCYAPRICSNVMILCYAPMLCSYAGTNVRSYAVCGTGIPYAAARRAVVRYSTVGPGGGLKWKGRGQA